MFSFQDKKATVFTEKAGSRIGRAAFSPDGHWLAYQSNEAGTAFGIFVQPFPSTGAKYPVVNGGSPFWSPDGREIIFNSGQNRMGFVSIATRPAFSFGEPSVRNAGFDGGNPNGIPRRWDITPDGKRIIGPANSSGADPASSSASTTPAAPQIQVVLNWFEDLKQRMSAR